eukprot:TRINITY_DN350_c0_g1_i1.p1 TRINITY_DN350_c0_g1~~TRINITY_DN350_c0_g1_i1.p1  ORF type:complete len:237 (-),score=47.97 TRINITY_DN350_c0_g1_i1:32-742(-)
MNTIFGNRSKFNIQSILDFTPLDKNTKSHLLKVYSTLGATVIASVIGCLIDLTLHLGGFFSTIGIFVSLFWLLSTPHTYENVNKRLAILMGFGVLQGISLGSLVGMALDIDNSIVLNAFLGTAAIFVCFSACALLSEKRSWLFLGGLLSSCLSFLALINLVNMFVGNRGVYDASLYIGLFIFSLFIIFDTQLIIEKAQHSNDFITHSLDLFLDMVQVFVRLVIILSKKEKKNSESR